jgi:hypothetical protein
MEKLHALADQSGGPEPLASYLGLDVAVIEVALEAPPGRSPDDEQLSDQQRERLDLIAKILGARP